MLTLTFLGHDHESAPRSCDVPVGFLPHRCGHRCAVQRAFRESSGISGCGPTVVRRQWAHGSRRRLRGALRAPRRAGAARRGLVPRRRGREGGAGRRQRGRQDHAAADRDRRPRAARGRDHAQRRPRRDAADGLDARCHGERRRPAALGVPAAGPRGGGRGGAPRAPADGPRRREDPDALCHGALATTPTRVATTSRSPGTCAARRRSGSATTRRSTATWPRCPAASRSGWCSSTCWPARTRCCCSTSRTTSSTCRASSGSRAGSTRARRRS